jgi:hypothetical protein
MSIFQNSSIVTYLSQCFFSKFHDVFITKTLSNVDRDLNIFLNEDLELDSNQLCQEITTIFKIEGSSHEK